MNLKFSLKWSWPLVFSIWSTDPMTRHAHCVNSWLTFSCFVRMDGFALGIVVMPPLTSDHKTRAFRVLQAFNCGFLLKNFDHSLKSQFDRFIAYLILVSNFLLFSRVVRWYRGFFLNKIIMLQSLKLNHMWILFI
jgi:hypothetical protein